MTMGLRHAALFAEYQSLMDEERTLWTVISGAFASMASAEAPEAPADVDLKRWAEVRERRAVLDRAIDAIALPRRSGWGDRVRQVA